MRLILVAIFLIALILPAVIPVKEVIDLNDFKELPKFHQQLNPVYVTEITDAQAFEGIITSPNYPKPYPIGSSSLVNLVATLDPDIDSIRLTFLDLEIGTSNHCQNEVLQVLVDLPPPFSLPRAATNLSLDNSREVGIQQVVYLVCGSNLPEPILIRSRKILLFFWNDAFSSGQNRGFKLKFQFLDSTRQLYDDCPEPGQFHCRNRRCIPLQLVCNHVDNCGDASDEDALTPCKNSPSIPYSTNYACGLDDYQPTVARVYGKDDPADQNSGVPLTNRIVGGNRVTRRNSLPFQVSIQIRNVETTSHVCGGILIHPMFVLTASHCIRHTESISDFKLIFGVQNLTADLRPEVNPAVQVRYATVVTQYPGSATLEWGGIYPSQVDMQHDITLVELNAPIHLSEHVWPACLPFLGEPILANRKCSVSGFGDTRGSGNSLSLKQAKQTILHSSQCRATLREFDIDYYSMICAKNELGNGPCRGDSGGPLFCEDHPDTPIGTSIIPRLAPEKHRRTRPGEIVGYLPLGELTADQIRAGDSHQPPDINRGRQRRYTVHGITSSATAGGLGGGFCGLESVPTIYARVSTKVDWILAQIHLALPRLSKEDHKQARGNYSSFLGYMFRTGQSQHHKFTPCMTKNPDQICGSQSCKTDPLDVSNPTQVCA